MHPPPPADPAAGKLAPPARAHRAPELGTIYGPNWAAGTSSQNRTLAGRPVFGASAYQLDLGAVSWTATIPSDPSGALAVSGDPFLAFITLGLFAQTTV